MNEGRTKVMAGAAVGLSVVALALAGATFLSSDERIAPPRVFSGDANSADVGARDGGGFTAAAVSASWGVGDQVTVSGQLQATSVLKARGRLTVSIFVDDLAVASTEMKLPLKSVISVPVQARLDSTEFDTGSHFVEIVGHFRGTSGENVAIEQGNVIVSVL